MSVLNISYQKDRVTFYTDTMSYDADGAAVGLTEPKAFISDNGSFMWAFRGPSALRCFNESLAGADDVGDAARMFAALVTGCDVPDLFKHGSIEATFAGESADGLAVLRFRVTEKTSTLPEPERLAHGVYVFPRPSEGFTMPASAPDALMVRLALAQHKAQGVALRKAGVGLCIGGVLHRTSVTKDGAWQEVAALYPSYEQDAAIAGDPCADDVAAFLAGAKVAA